MSNYNKSSAEKMRDFNELKERVKSEVECSILLGMVGREVTKTESSHIDWYLSPFREESTASFKVDNNTNCYIDFGESTKYHDVVDLAMRLNDMGNIQFDSKYSHLQRFSQAVLYLADIGGLLNESQNYNRKAVTTNRPVSQKSSQKTEPNIIINSVKKLENPILINYFVNERKIDEEIVRNTLKEVRYSFPKYPNKEFYSVGFKNRSKGFELRSPPTANNPKGFKGGTSPKDITLIKGTNPTRAFDVWEGFTDMMTLSTIKGIKSPQNHTIVMNSTSLSDKVLEFVTQYQEKHNSLKKIYLYVDNDKAGEEVLHLLTHGVKTAKELERKDSSTPLGLPELGIEIILQNKRLYPNHNDLNALHVETLKEQEVMQSQSFAKQNTVTNTKHTQPAR